MSVSSVPEHQRCCCHRTGSFPRRRSCWIFPCVIALLLTLTILFLTTIIASSTTQRYEYQRQRETIVKDDEHHHLVDDATIIRLTTTEMKKMMVTAATTKVITQERLGRGHDSFDNRYYHAIIMDDNTDQTNRIILDEEQQQKLEPHDYGILFTHYHKTGYVLSRHLLQLVIDLEYQSHGMPSPLQNATTTKMKNAIQFLKTVDHMDTITGERIAFGRRGNWNNNFVSARRHSDLHGCPPNFTLDIGAIHLQEAPDLFCTDEDLYSLLFGLARKNERYDNGTSIDIIENDMSRRSGVKVVHLVRNPFQMAVSNYLYHSQEPTVSLCFVCKQIVIFQSRLAIVYSSNARQQSSHPILFASVRTPSSQRNGSTKTIHVKPDTNRKEGNLWHPLYFRCYHRRLKYPRINWMILWLFVARCSDPTIIIQHHHP